MAEKNDRYKKKRRKVKYLAALLNFIYANLTGAYTFFCVRSEKYVCACVCSGRGFGFAAIAIVIYCFTKPHALLVLSCCSLKSAYFGHKRMGSKCLFYTLKQEMGHKSGGFSGRGQCDFVWVEENYCESNVRVMMWSCL